MTETTAGRSHFAPALYLTGYQETPNAKDDNG